MQSNPQQQIPNSQFLIPYCLHLADTTLILSHRNSEWCGHGPILEQDIALTNIALDLLGQARNFYQYAATLMGESFDEDKLAYLRNPDEFKNHLIVEQPNGDWAVTILRQFYFSCHQYYYYNELKNSSDEQLGAIATKALKEVTYHLRWSSEWVIRLGDGTQESNNKMQNAVEVLKDYVEELFVMSNEETELLQQNISIDLSKIKPLWQQKVYEVFAEATMQFSYSTQPKIGGKQGKHSQHLIDLLADMQVLQRTYPNSVW
ncbi:MAG: phenylacetate-CoA oxygenase subunit PaaC [Bacteroidetes bacterium]|jgi:ring-1,2-phenylacetyl-CoA epoxidase subunit PaaC|nr:phenylacetate-CoA oxygenase subunit PaaC [Bacteroidota bacterium]